MNYPEAIFGSVVMISMFVFLGWLFWIFKD